MTQNPIPNYIIQLAETLCNHLLDDLYYYKEPALGVLHSKCKDKAIYLLLNVVKALEEELP